MDPVSRAQNADSSKKTVGRPFKKGQSGNPGGRKKKWITQIYDDLLAKKENREAIAETVMGLITAKRMASILTLREMAERTEGKIDQGIALSGLETVDAAIEAIRARKAKKTNGNGNA
jgi:hypothetical protein